MYIWRRFMVPKAGFTLIELLVVVLIIGILAAMAWPQYLKAVERSRMAEAVNMINILVQAQQRKYMQTNRYASSLRGLDIALKNVSGNSFYTKGNAVSGTSENGFYIVLGEPGVSADRVSAGEDLQYKYYLYRYYTQRHIICHAVNDAGKDLCADFCGIDTPVSACCSDGTAGWCAN